MLLDLDTVDFSQLISHTAFCLFKVDDTAIFLEHRAFIQFLPKYTMGMVEFFVLFVLVISLFCENFKLKTSYFPT